MFKISSIIPLKTDNFSFYKERLIIRSKMDLSNIETIVVDDGSPIEVAKEIAEFCTEFNFLYKRLETERLPFSLSRARNAGVDIASGEWIIMEDADIVYQHDFYNRMIVEVDYIDETPFNFITIPVIYLKEEISKEIFLHEGIDKFIPKILSKFQFENPVGSEDNVIVESYAPATALFVVRKKILNLIGGYDEYFVGWGGEDRDVAFRLLAVNNKIGKLPSFFEITKAWSLNKTYDYEGWRSLYRLTGDYLSNKGIYGFHLYHPKLEWREKTDTKKNIDFAKEKSIDFYKKKKIKPRFDLKKPINIIIGYNPYLVNEYVLEAIENICIIDDDKSVSYLKIFDNIQKFENIESIYFWNPFGTEWKLNLYKKLRENNYKTVVVERGALPNSYYFDENGFCIESDSYKNYELVVEQNFFDFQEKFNCIKNYLDEIRYSDKALEKQNERIPVGLLRLKLGIDSSKKIIFCPLQLSTDTVTNYCVEPGRSYSDYLHEIKKIENYLPDDWVLVIKNHPLSVDKYSSEKSINADAFHINDLIEASSTVILFNSGCGLLSMAFEKKVFYYGKCFYAIDGVNSKFQSAEQIYEEIVHGDFSVDMEKVFKFFYFLLFHFYSFAEVENKVVSSNGAMKNVLTNIFYSALKLPRKETIKYKKYISLSSESILLGRYGKSMYLELKKNDVNNKETTDSVKKNSVVASPKNNSSEKPLAVKNIPLSTLSSASSKSENLSVPSQKSVGGIGLNIYKLLVTPFLSKKKNSKLRSDPYAFFQDSSSKINKIIGKSLL